MNDDESDILNLIQTKTISSDKKPGLKLFFKMFSNEGKFYHYREKNQLYIFKTPTLNNLLVIYFRLEIGNEKKTTQVRLIPIFPSHVFIPGLIFMLMFIVVIPHQIFSNHGVNFTNVFVSIIYALLVLVLFQILKKTFIRLEKIRIEEFLEKLI